MIDSTIYENLCLEHLNDSTTYTRVYTNPQFSIFQNCKNTLFSLNQSNHISNSLYKKLLKHIHYKKLPSFNIMPKLHKKEFDIRPIVNCANSTLSVISKTIDFFLFQLALIHFSYLKDSQHLIQQTLNKKFSPEDELSTSDVVSLYTNIPLDPCITIISDLISKKTYEHFSSYGFHILLTLVLKNNFFYYKSRLYNSFFYFFLQLKGVAMGTACGPSVANLYMAHFEIKCKHLLNTCLYHRYIDDLLIIKNKLISIDFKEIFPSLKLKTETNKEVVFLDTKISLNRFGFLDFNLYIKPTNTFCYLSVLSNHPSFICREIPKSLIYRIRRICSKKRDFYYHTSILHKNLLKRGYSSNNILPLIRKFAELDRSTLIPYKTKQNFLDNNILFGLNFDRFLPNLSSFTIQTWHNSIDSNSLLKKVLFKCFYKINLNLNSYFVNNIPCPIASGYFKKCSNSKCTVCSLANTDNILFNKYNIPILIPSFSTCTSESPIYLITCKKCKVSYVGESGRNVGVRIKEHLAKIRRCEKLFLENISNFETFLSKNPDCYHLYKHFSVRHNILQDFTFQIFIIKCNYFRLRLETDLMFCLNTVFPNGLNTSVSQLKYLNTYAYPLSK